MIKLGVSACLLGQKVRYDGKDKFANLTQYFDLKIYQLTPICPEIEMGLSIPRPPIEMRFIDKQIRLVQVDNYKQDFTHQFNNWFSKNTTPISQFNGYILKSKSPSCGYKTTPYYENDKTVKLNHGLFVTSLLKIKPRTLIINEKDLEEDDKLIQFKSILENQAYS